MLALLLAATLTVGSAQLCGRVVDGVCVSPVEGSTVPAGAVSFLTTISGHEPGTRVEHVWRREEKPVRIVPFTLEGSPARVVSTHEPLEEGEWSVAVTDAAGRELARVPFRVPGHGKPSPPQRVPVEPPRPEP